MCVLSVPCVDATISVCSVAINPPEEKRIEKKNHQFVEYVSGSEVLLSQIILPLC